MNRCILHVGTPKTGTSSIQETLYFGLRDPRFHYFSGGEVSAARLLLTQYTEREMPIYFWGARGRDAAFVERQMQSFRRKWEKCLQRVRGTGATLIMSGESCWRMLESELSRLQSDFESHGFRIQVVAYVRPWKGFLESVFQQQAKHHCIFGKSDNWDILSVARFPLDYQQRIETLDRVFGRDQVLVRKFDPRNFPEGCVVHDFCDQLGITLDAASIRRVNESLSMDAVRFLAAYGRYGNREGMKGMWRYWQHNWLVERLGRMSGPPLRLHSSLVESLLDGLLAQVPWLEERLGASFAQDWRKDDGGDCIRGSEDLFRFREESLHWLAEQTGGGLPAVSQGEEAARHVGPLIHRLRYRPPEWAMVMKGASRQLNRAWTRLVKGR